MSYYIVTELVSGHSVRTYQTYKEALHAWDKATEAALPGDYLEFLQGEPRVLLSSYRPMGRDHFRGMGQ